MGGDHGTELILLPSVPQRIEISASTDFSALTETPRAKNVVRGTLPEPKASALASNLPFHDLPVIPVNYEKASKYLKNGTGTDESEAIREHWMFSDLLLNVQVSIGWGF